MKDEAMKISKAMRAAKAAQKYVSKYMRVQGVAVVLHQGAYAVRVDGLEAFPPNLPQEIHGVPLLYAEGQPIHSLQPRLPEATDVPITPPG